MHRRGGGRVREFIARWKPLPSLPSPALGCGAMFKVVGGCEWRSLAYPMQDCPLVLVFPGGRLQRVLMPEEDHLDDIEISSNRPACKERIPR